jgi:hypothetical protein
MSTAQGSASGGIVARVVRPSPATATPLATARYGDGSGKGTDILAGDPDVIEREVNMLRADAAASKESTVGPSCLVLTEEQIREIEKKKLILQ